MSKIEQIKKEKTCTSKATIHKLRNEKKHNYKQHVHNTYNQQNVQNVQNDKCDYIIVKCPHCNQSIQIFKKKLNCRIFRHGVYKKNGNQISPHTAKSVCDKLTLNDLIYGCGKPFRINVDNMIEICEYI